MPRISLPENTSGSNLDRSLMLVPEIKGMYDNLYSFLWNEEELEKEVKEMVRLYLANVNGCQTCMSMSYTGTGAVNGEMKKAVVAGDYTAFTPFEQKLILFIETYRRDPKEITDEEIHWLRQTFNETGMVKLLAFIQFFDGLHKMIVSLDLYDFCSLGGKK